MIADWNHGHQKICAHADDGQVAGALAHDQEQSLVGIETQCRRSIAHGNGGDRFSWITDNASINDVHGCDAVRSGVRNIKQAGIGAEDAASGGGSQFHVVAHLMRPGIDGLKSMGFGRNHVEFATVRLEEHVRGLSGKTAASSGCETTETLVRRASVAASWIPSDPSPRFTTTMDFPSGVTRARTG